MLKEKMTGPKFYLGVLLKQNFPDLETEYKFCLTRKFRADYYIPSLNVLVEYEGVFNAAKSRHTSVLGYTNDCEKYNLTQKLGFRLLRYTAANYKNVLEDLKYIKNDFTLGGTI
jgi:hypothetical protein